MKRIIFIILFLFPFVLIAQTKTDTFTVNYHQKISKDSSQLFIQYVNGMIFEFWAVGKGKHSFKKGSAIRMLRAETDRTNPFVIVYSGDTYTLTPYKPRRIHR